MGRPNGPGRRNRPSKEPKNRVTKDRLFDDAGQEWARVRNDLSRDEVRHLLAESSVKVGIHRNYGDPLRWVPAELRWQVWRSEIEPEFFDNRNWRPPPGAPGQLPYRALLYRADGRQLLLFDCMD